MDQRLTKIFFAAIFLITISSCDRKSCSKVMCPAGKSCYQGVCLCNDGYEGINCDTLSAYKYTGNWLVSENCGGSYSGFPTSYSVYIAPPGNSYAVNVISINAFFGIGPLYVQIQNTDPNNLGTTLFVPAQNPGGSISVQNSYGNYIKYSNGGAPQINLTLNYTANGFNYTCQETLYKQ